MDRIPGYAKAIVGALIAGLGSLQQALDNDIMTRSEWVGVVLATLVGLGIVAAVPNRATAARRADAGHANLVGVLIVVAVVVVFLVIAYAAGIPVSR